MNFTNNNFKKLEKGKNCNDMVESMFWPCLNFKIPVREPRIEIHKQMESHIWSTVERSGCRNKFGSQKDIDNN